MRYLLKTVMGLGILLPIFLAFSNIDGNPRAQTFKQSPFDIELKRFTDTSTLCS